MRIKGILFDFDGVVLRSMEQHLQAWQHAFRKYGAEIDDIEFYKQEGRGVKSVAEVLVDKFDLDRSLIPRIMKAKKTRYNRIATVEFYEGFFDVLNFIKQRNLKMAIVTGGERKRIEPFARQYLDGYFSGFVTSDDVQHTKPAAEPYEEGAHLLGLDPKECLVIENAPMGIRSARAAGCTVIAIQTTLPESYLYEADYITSNFTGVKHRIRQLIK